MAAHAETHSDPVPTPPAHTAAYMGMDARRGMWRGFGVQVQWWSLILIMVLGYATFTITMGVPWLGALIGFTVFGLIAGMLMNMGGGWIATVIGLFVLGLVVQGFVWLGHVLI
jgi:hypothetical protein